MEKQTENRLKYTDIIISNRCRPTFPCKHLVTIKGVELCMGGREIVKLYRDNGLDAPEHFHYLL